MSYLGRYFYSRRNITASLVGYTIYGKLLSRKNARAPVISPPPCGYWYTFWGLSWTVALIILDCTGLWNTDLDGYTGPEAVISHRAGRLPKWVEVCFDIRAVFGHSLIPALCSEIHGICRSWLNKTFAVSHPSVYRTAVLLTLDAATPMTSFSKNRKSRASIEAPRNDRQWWVASSSIQQGHANPNGISRVFSSALQLLQFWVTLTHGRL